MPLVICFAGQIGSGKTSVSSAVADVLQWKRASFGDFLRAEVARRGGDPSHREALQDLGHEYVTKGTEEFSRLLLASGNYLPGDDFIVDGVRHVDILVALRMVLAPTPTKLVFLLSDEDVRRQRVASRDGTSSDLDRADAHPVESDLKAHLPELAAVQIDVSTSSKEEVVASVLKAIRGWL